MQEGINGDGNIYQFPEKLPSDSDTDTHLDEETPLHEEDIQESVDRHPSSRNKAQADG